MILHDAACYLRMMGVMMKYCMSMAMYHDTFTQSASPGLIVIKVIKVL